MIVMVLVLVMLGRNFHSVFTCMVLRFVEVIRAICKQKMMRGIF